MNRQEGAIMITCSNRLVNVLDPSSSDPISILDIAHGLSNICRFGGQTLLYYSVAEHCVNCLYAAPDDLSPAMKMQILLHDAHEAYTGDIIRPIKHFIPEIKNHIARIEFKMQLFILNSLGLEFPLLDRDYIKEIDSRMLVTEAYYLFEDMYSNGRFIWPDVERYSDVNLKCYSPTKAAILFLDNYRHLEEAIQKDAL